MKLQFSPVYSHHFTRNTWKIEWSLWSRRQGHWLPPHPHSRCHLLKGSLTPTCNSGTLNRPNKILMTTFLTTQKRGQPKICIAMLMFSGEQAISMCNECVVWHSLVLVNNNRLHVYFSMETPWFKKLNSDTSFFFFNLVFLSLSLWIILLLLVGEERKGGGTERQRVHTSRDGHLFLIVNLGDSREECDHNSARLTRKWSPPPCKCLHRRLQSYRRCPKAHQGNERAGQAFVRAAHNKRRI